MYHIMINIKIILLLVLATKLYVLMTKLVDQCKNIEVEMKFRRILFKDA